MTPLRQLIPALLLAGAASMALAQGAPSASPPAIPAAKKELVQKILQLQQPAFENIARGLAEQSIGPVAQQATAVLQNRIAPDQREAVAKEIQAEVTKYGNEVVPLLRDRAGKLAPETVGVMLADKLTEDELKQVVAMIESPIYRKYQSMGVDMQRVLTEKLVADTRAMVEPKLKALQVTVGQKLGLQGPAASSSAASKAAKPAAKASAPSAKAPAPAASK